MSDFLRKEKVDLARYLPAYLSKDETYDRLLKAIGKDQEDIRLKIRSLLEQLFVASATDCIDEWEEFLGISGNRAHTIKARRDAVLAKIRGQQTVTENFLTRLVNLYVSDRLGTIKSYPSDYAIEILYHGGQVTDYAALRETVRTYLPAHLGFKLVTITNGNLHYYGAGTVQCYRKNVVDMTVSYDLMTFPTRLHTAGSVTNNYKQMFISGGRAISHG